MGIPESQLERWSHQGSITQSSETYNTIRNVLDDAASPYAGKDYTIFLQGSYGNDTNIYAESDHRPSRVRHGLGDGARGGISDSECDQQREDRVCNDFGHRRRARIRVDRDGRNDRSWRVAGIRGEQSDCGECGGAHRGHGDDGRRIALACIRASAWGSPAPCAIWGRSRTPVRAGRWA